MAKPKPAKTIAKSKKPVPAKSTKPARSAKPVKSAKSASKPAIKADEKPQPKPAKATTSVKLKLKPRAAAKPVPAKPVLKPKAQNGAVPPPKAPVIKVKLTPFLEKQKDRLLQLQDSLLDDMSSVAKDNLRTRPEGSDASAFGMHQADAGSDAYDRDFALSLLSQEQDALYEIQEALKRLDLGTYGICEASGKAIAHARLEALPFARLTVECQAQVEKMGKVSRARVPVTSLFGLTDEEPGETEEEETVTETKE